jgi:nucleoid DNA-binding protein
MARKKATKKTVKKAPAKKAVKKAPAKKKAAAKKPAAKKAKALPVTAITQTFNKTKTLEYIAEATELSKKEVGKVFETLNNLVHRHVKKKAAGEFTIPGLMKLVVKEKPATKARKGTNPFTGEEMMFKAKPKRRIIKVRALKKLKEMAE